MVWPFVPWGVLPLVGLLAVLLFGATRAARHRIEQPVRQRVRAQLDAGQLQVAQLAVDGQNVVLSGTVPNEEVGARALSNSMGALLSTRANSASTVPTDPCRTGDTLVLFGGPSLFSTDLAIDLGTASTCIFARGAGIVLNEPSILAKNTLTGRIEAFGAAASEMLGRTPRGMTAIRPMRGGVIADFDAVQKMLEHFINKARRRKGLIRPRVVIGVPSEITPVERRAVKDSVYRAKAREVCLIEEAMAAAVGAGLPITESSGSMIVDIGGGTTDIAIISLAGIVYTKSVRAAGDAMDEAITHFVRREYNLLIGERTAERVKIELGSAAPLAAAKRMEVKGRHQHEGRPTTIILDDGDVRQALAEPVKQVIRAVREALERIPPELSADVYDRGMVLSGGGALLQNLDARLRAEIGVPVQVAEDPIAAVVMGAGRTLSDPSLLRKISIEDDGRPA